MSTQYKNRALIIIPAAYLDAANQAATSFPGGAGTFTVGLSADGNLPPSHYWADTQLTDLEYGQIQALIAGNFPLARVESYDHDANPGRPDEILTEMGLQRLKPIDDV